MSTAISSTQASTILPKSVAMLRIKDEKPRLRRASSIDAIKRINTFICSPQSYILPAILITWLKTGQNGFQNSTEKTILTFRSVIFGSILVKYLLSSVHRFDLKKVFQVISNVERVLLISLAFKLAVAVLTVECYLCVQYLSLKYVPVGLGFLLLCVTAIVVLGHKINKFYLLKRDIKRKIH